MNVLEVCKLWKVPRENKESAHRGRNWEWCSHKPRNANIPQSWKRQEIDAPLAALEGYGSAKPCFDAVLCYGLPFTIAMREYICLVWNHKLMFICYCSRWKHTGSERGHFFSLPFTGRRNLFLKTHCTPPLRSCELSSSFKDAEIEASGIFSLYKSLSENIYNNSFGQTMASTMWRSGHVIDSRRDMETDWPNPRAQHWYLDSDTDCALQMNGFTSIWVSLSSLLSGSVDPHILPWQHLLTFPRVNSYQAMAWLTLS